MKRISANYIYLIEKPPLKNGIVEINNQGEIINIIDTKGDLRESRNLEFYNGVITPGFVNTHCHLELSGLKGLINKNAGLPHFLKSMISFKRNGKIENSIKAIELYDSLMRKNGIVAVGDIANTDLTISTKKKSQIFYHTFIEAIGLAANYDEIFNLNKKTLEEYLNNGLNTSIVPHAPYSVSKNLFLKIKEFSETHDSTVSIHNQECEEEDLMFKNKSGELVNIFLDLHIDLREWKATGKASIESVTDYLPKNNNIIFVHNTFSLMEDVLWMKEKFKNAYWCLCPNSNLYIENKLPDLDIFYPYSDNITLGTDSLASNSTLSILDEMKTIVKYNDKIVFEDVIKWATLNGAKALNIDQKFGSIEIGKTPGLNLISNFNFEKMQLSDKSEIKTLI